ncbi:MAG: hypothetical protein HOO67_03315 [Candidatus Peribacteraceae bacterium]|nr:hypothetical protein [Candidatus Peribacteraceae bacterium]
MPITIKLDWTAAPAAEAVSKYEVFESKDGAAFAKKGDAPTNTYTILNPLAGIYRWQVRSVNFVGNGAFSDIVFGPAVPGAVTDVTVTVTQS